MHLYIAETTKSACTKLMDLIILLRGSVTNAYACAKRWIKLKTLPLYMPADAMRSQAWRANDTQYALLKSIIDKSAIPYENVEGFKLSGGEWFICLKQIGWVRSSKLLDMKITKTGATK